MDEMDRKMDRQTNLFINREVSGRSRVTKHIYFLRDKFCNLSAKTRKLWNQLILFICMNVAVDAGFLVSLI